MTRNDIIALIEKEGPFTATGLYKSDSPTFGRHAAFERPRQFILNCLQRKVTPAFEYKSPDHTGYLYRDGSHLCIDRVAKELGITNYVRASTGCYSTIISFQNFEDSN